MDIRTIVEFNTIALHCNLSAAARSLNVSQPTLSKHLRMAERELGATLIERTQGSQSLKLTPEGEIFQQKGIEMLDIWNDLNVALAKRKGKSRILIGSSIENALHMFVSEVQERLDKEGERMELHWSNLATLPIQALREGVLDAVLEPLSSQTDTHGLTCIPIYAERLLLVCHRSDPLAQEETVDANRLRDVRLLALLKPWALGVSGAIHDLCNAHGFSPRFESFASYPSELALMSRLLGPGYAAVVPASLARLYQSMIPQATLVKIDDEKARIQVAVIFADHQREPVWRVAETARELAREKQLDQPE